MNKEVECALYHGDDFIMIGTKKEIAKYLNIKVKTVAFYMSPVYLSRTNGNGYVVIRLDEE